MALGSDSSKMVLVLMDMPFCGRPRKPRPLISVILSTSVVHIFWKSFRYPSGVPGLHFDFGHHHLREGCSIRGLNFCNPLDGQRYGVILFW
ncbi:hypothetical protein EAF00_004239 [Botryotinia globosa]|nr:hypothetical protein EAF00_004239 [Botryotinia globosa]